MITFPEPEGKLTYLDCAGVKVPSHWNIKYLKVALSLRRVRFPLHIEKRIITAFGKEKLRMFLTIGGGWPMPSKSKLIKCKYCHELDSVSMMHQDRYTGDYYHKACAAPLRDKGVAVKSKVREVNSYRPHTGLWRGESEISRFYKRR